MGAKVRSAWKSYLRSPYQVKLSALIMGAGQLCYGQIVKGLVYLSAFAFFVYYFATSGIKNIIGFFTLGTVAEDLWLGRAGDNSLTMLILGLMSIFVLIFAVVVHISNIKDVIFTSHEVESGRSPRKFKRTLLTIADDKFHTTALVFPIIGVCIFTVLPIVFMICMAFTNLGGDVVHPVLADWSLSAWKKIFSLGKIGSTFGRIFVWNVLWAVASTALNFVLGLGMALLLNKRNVRGSKFWRAFPILA